MEDFPAPFPEAAEQRVRRAGFPGPNASPQAGRKLRKRREPRSRVPQVALSGAPPSLGSPRCRRDAIASAAFAYRSARWGNVPHKVCAWALRPTRHADGNLCGKTAIGYNADRQATEYELLRPGKTKFLQFPSTHRPGEVKWDAGVLNDAFRVLLNQDDMSRIRQQLLRGGTGRTRTRPSRPGTTSRRTDPGP